MKAANDSAASPPANRGRLYCMGLCGEIAELTVNSPVDEAWGLRF